MRYSGLTAGLVGQYAYWEHRSILLLHEGECHALHLATELRTGGAFLLVARKGGPLAPHGIFPLKWHYLNYNYPH